jgi:hypothetical protein
MVHVTPNIVRAGTLVEIKDIDGKYYLGRLLVNPYKTDDGEWYVSEAYVNQADKEGDYTIALLPGENAWDFALVSEA